MRYNNKDPFATLDTSAGSASGRSLEWEEGALDGTSEVEGFADETRIAPKTRWLQLLILAACIVLVLQLFNLQVIQGSKLKELSEGNRLRIQTILAPRGYIIDRNGAQLARNTASFSLVATPVDLPKDGVDTVIGRVSSLFSIPTDEIKQALSKTGVNKMQPILIKRGLTQQESILFETYATEMTGFSLSSVPIREYITPEIFSHALGYTGVIADTELADLADQGYDLNDFIGKSGIELSYERFLRGTNGNKQVEVDATGRPIKVLGNVEPQPGNVVQLNIDAGLQEQLYKRFLKNSNQVKGAAVALDPKTGAVLALVSVPGYNNNLFAPGISATDYQALLQDKNLPLFNRSIAGTYPPGSTIKMVTAGAALEEGVVTADTIIQDRGVLVIPNQFNPGIQYNFYGWKRNGLGAMNVRSAIAESSDIYFYTVAGGHPASKIQGLGAEKVADYYRKFGMGAATGIDIQGEKTGIVADPAWKAKYFKNDPISSKWYLGDTYHISIGQGDMLTTPLQVAVWTAAIANNGTLNKPVLLKQVLDQSGKIIYTPKPELLIQKSISDANMKIIQAGMRDNVISVNGSGRQLQSLSISAAGKTGTSQFDGSDPSRTHAWYTAYAPYENPEIVITVLVEAGGEGHAAAVPIVKEALQWWAEIDMENNSKQTVIDGRSIAAELLVLISERIRALPFTPMLCDIIVGDDPVSLSYVNIKAKRARNCGIDFSVIQLPKESSEQVVIDAIRKVQANPYLCGLIVQLPLPINLNATAILSAIGHEVDVDVINPEPPPRQLHDVSLIPPTAGAILHILDTLPLDLSQERFVVVGNGNLVGKPVYEALYNRNYEVKVVVADTPHRATLLKQATIVISGVGKAGIVTGQDVSEGVVVIDAGTSESGGSIAGDVDFASVFAKARYITPSPGGVGPVTVAQLLQNVLVVAENKVRQGRVGISS